MGLRGLRNNRDGSGIRQAVQDDIAELVRLRALLFEKRGGDFFNPPSEHDDWPAALAAVLKEQIADDTVRILVVDGTHGTHGTHGIVVCGIGVIGQRLPGPHLSNGRIGHVAGVVTDPAHRRRGHGRAVMRALLDWFREREVSRVDLYASDQGAPLYRELGFTDHPDPALYWRP
ncbi:GNAT family N-acetyltransferase [Streptomyces uncialis]|uniref:GNAT family N-acetyltransferase n=1 Tax=Streptomyces uncialis TaxID=1048205 RepID=UPI00383028FA